MENIGGIINESLVIDHDTDLGGIVAGDVTVNPGCLLRLGGIVGGDVILQPGARLHMTGILNGRVVHA
ncbi:hypothetical protein [Sphingomonas mollis]|uniref:Cell shape determination protein CcmA n=1 Tax=Sphingomonas mollis TaxID=2795726 RepID=A0ABS0XPQ9_9SPHN|nr:hypothetical protein [Sphingomonas sp. BT553]MBJ6122037.1 hypothetical protein [Sphingomonas sp. BT553]